MAWRQPWMVGSVLLATLLVPMSAAAQRVVFINTEPVVLNADSGQDPSLNSYATTGFVPGAISGWPGLTELQRTLLLYHLKEGSVPFDIIYTFERPMMGTYDMLVMGTDADEAALFPDLAGCSPAIGLADCDDANAENISFLFYGCMAPDDQTDMHRVAFRIFSALGFGWGLENLSGAGQIMASYGGTSLQFGDSCTNISGTELCPGHVGCPAGQQNSTADLNARIGARIDDGAPYLTINSPENDMVVEPDIQVAASVGDLFGGLTVELEVVEAMQSLVDQTPPYSWSLTGIPQGTWTLRVNVTDADMNMVTEEVTVCVDLPACGLEPGSESTGADGTAGPESTGGDEFTTDVFEPETTTGEEPPDDEPIDPSTTTGPPPVNPPTFGEQEPETGCQCQAQSMDHSGDAPIGLLSMLLVLGAITRRE